jgi:hypothetical protein
MGLGTEKIRDNKHGHHGDNNLTVGTEGWLKHTNSARPVRQDTHPL